MDVITSIVRNLVVQQVGKLIHHSQTADFIARLVCLARDVPVALHCRFVASRQVGRNLYERATGGGTLDGDVIRKVHDFNDTCQVEQDALFEHERGRHGTVRCGVDLDRKRNMIRLCEWE